MTAARALPRLLLLADGFASGRPGLDAAGVGRRTEALVAAGVPWVMLRDPEAPDGRFAEAAAALADRLRQRQPGVLLSVNGRPAVARALAAGWHRRGSASGAFVRRKGEVWPAGPSVHAAQEAARAARAGADYVLFSPVWPTATHPGAPPAGLDALRRVVEQTGAPVLALGGLTAARARTARAAGAHGVAVLSDLLEASDLEAAVAAYLEAVQ